MVVNIEEDEFVTDIRPLFRELFGGPQFDNSHPIATVDCLSLSAHPCWA